MSDDPLIQIAADTASNKSLLKELLPLVKETHETLHVKCGIDDNGDTGLVSVVKDDHKFVRGCRSWITGARKAALYGALSAAAVAVLGVAARGCWILGIWLLGG